MTQHDIQRDNVLVPITELRWIAKNVFTVRVPLYNKVISCELTAVDVPRGTAPALEAIVGGVVGCVERAVHKYLRQDHYSTFPLQGYGDVVFTTDEGGTQWASLQETILKRGIGRIVRPVIARLEELIESEAQGASCLPQTQEGDAKPCTWAREMMLFESSPSLCRILTGQIVSVLRGDVYVVRWDEECTAGATAVGVGGERWLPPNLVILDSVRCFSSRSDDGYMALRWAQKNLIYSRVEVCVHSMSPSEKDVTNNTQMFTYEQLCSVRATVRVLTAPQSGSDIGDVGSALLSRGLGFVRQVVDAAVPRSSKFCDLLRVVSMRCRRVAEIGATEDLKEWAPDGPPLPDAVLQRLQDFLGPEWSKLPPLVMLWQTTMWDGNFHLSMHDYPPRTHTDRPMNSLWKMELLVQEDISFEGYISFLALVQESHHNTRKPEQQRRVFLRVSVDAVLTDRMVCNTLKRIQGNTLGRILLCPSEEIIFGRTGNVVVTYDRALSTVQMADAVCISVACTPYTPSAYNPKKHHPDQFGAPVPLAEGESQISKVINLKLPDKVDEMLFVIDVQVDFGPTEDSLRHRVVYLLSDAVHIPDDDSSTMSVEDDESHGDKEDEASLSSEDSMPERVESAEENLASKKYGLAAADNGGTLMQTGKATRSTFEFYHASVDFYFEMDPAKVQQGEQRCVEAVREWSKELMYRDVRCVPVGIGVVNGRRGYVGDIQLLCGTTESNLTGGARSLLFNLGEKWWPHAYRSPLTCGDAWFKIPLKVQAKYLRLRDATIANEAMSRASIVAEWDYFLQQLCKEMSLAGIAAGRFVQSDADSNPCVEPEHHSLLTHVKNDKSDNIDGIDDRGEGAKGVFCVTAGELVLWYDADTPMPQVKQMVGGGSSMDLQSGLSQGPVSPVFLPSFLPPHVPLTVMSIFPRQLFSAYYKQHRSPVSKNIVREVKRKSDLHVDAPFFRLPHHFLPNAFSSNHEHLPVGARNVEWVFSDSLQRGKIPRKSDSPAVMYYASERNFVAVLSLLMMLQPRKRDKESSTMDMGHMYSGVYKLLKKECDALYDIETPRICCNAILHRIFVDFRGERKEQEQEQPPAFFLGSRSALVYNAQGLADVVMPMNGPAIRRFASILGVERLVNSPVNSGDMNMEANASANDSVIPLVEAGDEECHPMGTHRIGPHPLESSTPWLYRPFPWLALLGQPLIARDEYDAETLGSSSTATGNSEKRLVRRHLSVVYKPMHFKLKNPYRSFSYGRLARRMIYQLQRSYAARGGEVKDYISLLLHRYPRNSHSAAAGVNEPPRFPDGTLHVYGTASEPLYLFYQSRKQLRFRLGMLWPSILANAADACDTETENADLEAEERLLTLLSEAGKRIIDMVAEKTAQSSSSSASDGGGGGGGGGERPPLRVYLAFRLDFHTSQGARNVLRVSVFPIQDEEPVEGVVGRSDGDQEAELEWEKPSDEGNRNPCRPFDMMNNVYGRMAKHVLLVRYCAEQRGYTFLWDEGYGQKLKPPEAPTDGHQSVASQYHYRTKGG